MVSKRNVVKKPKEENAFVMDAVADDGPALNADQVVAKPKRGRPLGSGKKAQLTVRFDADIISAFKQGGKGWQTMMNNALKEWLGTRKAP